MCTACGARPAAHSSCSRTSSRYPSSGTVLTSPTGTLSPNTGASPHPTFRCAGEPPCGAPRPNVMRTQTRATALARSSAHAALMFPAASCRAGRTAVAAPADDPSTVPSESPSPETELSIEIDYQEDPGQGEAPEPESWTLTCSPAGGDHPDPEAACAALEEVGAEGFEEVPEDSMCTHIMGGPETARVTGHLGEIGRASCRAAET